MQSAIGDIAHKAEVAISGAMESNKKIAEIKNDYRNPKDGALLTSDFGVKNPTHDNWLSATTEDRKGPALLEDNLAREKVSLIAI
jgi:catalase